MPQPRQTSLFDAADATPERALRVVETIGGTQPTDKAQATFNKLVGQIEQQRALLARWRAFEDRHHQRVANELSPLTEALWVARRQMALIVAQALQKASVIRGKRLRAKASRLLIELTQELLQEKPDDELKAIHDRHAALSYDEDRELELAMAKALFEELHGQPLDDDIQSLDELAAHLHQKQRDAEATPRGAPKGKKAQAAATAREQAAKEISQSVREVYRKLASALHPDREADPAARAHKSALMARVNRAYEAGDLLELLNIQLEIEQIDAAHLSALPQARLAHYNQVLREQLKELQAEVQTIVAVYRSLAPPARDFSPEHVDRALTADIENERALLKQARADIALCQDPAELNRFLKEFSFEEDVFDLDEFAEMAFIAELMDTRSSAPKRRRRK